MDLDRIHFGPTGDRDCADAEVTCRLVWGTEAGRLLKSEVLGFTGPRDPKPISFVATTGHQPGLVEVRAHGVDDDWSVDDIFSPPQLRTIQDDVEYFADFDANKLDLSWRVDGLCGFGLGDPPIGAEDLEGPPAWWTHSNLEPAADETNVQSSFGASCDLLADDRSNELVGGDSLELTLSRDVYGFGGWIDCAVTSCWLELIVTWHYPMPQESTLGSDIVVERVLLDIPEGWPSIRPSIAIVEPGPYHPGQQVTVEVRDHPLSTDGLAIGWCPGGDGYCSYNFSSLAGGVHRVTRTIPRASSSCGSNRCYFEIGSGSEGLAPPAIVIVPTDTD